MRLVCSVLLVGVCLAGCAEHHDRKWFSYSEGASTYSATLTERDYNQGESNAFKIRIDAAPLNDDGWFFVEDLHTGMINSEKPDLHWTSPNDIMVVVHTAKIEGQTRRLFGGGARPAGSLTIRYLADQTE